MQKGFSSSSTHASYKTWDNGQSHSYHSRNSQIFQSQNGATVKESEQQQRRYHLPNLPNNFDFRLQEKSVKPSSSNSDFTAPSTNIDSSSESVSSSVLPGLALYGLDDKSSSNTSSSSSLSNLEIFQTGLRRPASTGVIGIGRNMPSSSSSVVESLESLGLGSAHQKNSSKLDLIQEDFPKSPSPEFSLQEKRNESTSTSTSSLQHSVQREPYLKQNGATNGSVSSHPISSIQYSTYGQNPVDVSYNVQRQQLPKMLYNNPSANTNINSFDLNVSFNQVIISFHEELDLFKSNISLESR